MGTEVNQAARACQDINARAFTVGNHIAFNSGEYDPSSAEGQHVLAHELAHVRQQTGGAVSMLPQQNQGLEIDPDPQLERDAEQTAEQVMRGGTIGVHRMRKSEVHVQRMGLNQEAGDNLIAKYREAIMAKSDLDEEDIRQIEEEVGLDVSNTTYSGGQVHDALNYELLDEAESVLDDAGRELREMRGQAENAEAAVESVDGVEATESFQDDLEWHAETQSMIEDLGGEEQLKLDEEQAKALQGQQAEMEGSVSAVRSKLEEVDSKLQQLLGEENIRLTEEQKTMAEKAIKEAADVGAGTVTGVVLNYLVGTGFDKTLVDLYNQLLANNPKAMAAGMITVSTIYKGIKAAASYIRGGGDDVEDIVDTDESAQTRFD